MQAALSATGLRASFVDESERVENLEELLGAAVRFVADHAAVTVSDVDRPVSGLALSATFVESVALTEASDPISGVDSDDDDSGADADGLDRVSLMTAHAAKGREFPCVWVVGCEDRLFPHARHVEDPAAVFEERRLFLWRCLVLCRS